MPRSRTAAGLRSAPLLLAVACGACALVTSISVGCGLDWTVPADDGRVAPASGGGAEAPASGSSGQASAGGNGAGTSSTATGSSGSSVGAGGDGAGGGPAASSAAAGGNGGGDVCLPAAAQTPCDTGTWADCDACVAGGSDCTAVYNACTFEPACLLLFSCVDSCDISGGGEPCYQDCYADYPDGLAKFKAEQRCYICAQCPTTSDDAEWAYFCCEPSSPLP